MKNLKTLQNTISKALQHLADYQSVFDYDEQSEEDWNNLQETIRELYAIQEQIKKERKRWKQYFISIIKR